MATRRLGTRSVAMTERGARGHPALKGGRALPAVGGRWYVLGYPWLSIDANDRRSALEATRTRSLNG